MDAGERPSVSRLYGRGKRVKQCKRGILEPNWCAIVHDFWGGPGVWGRRGLKVSSDVPGRLGSIPELPVYLVGASWFVKQEKRRERGILRPNQCVITHDFRGGPRVWGCGGPKIKPVLPGRLGSILLLPVCMGGAIWLVKRVKRREPRILRPNQCAIAHGFWGGLGVQGCHGRKINLDVSGRLGSISVLPVCVGEAIWLVKRLKRCKWGILGPNRCAIAHGSKGGPGVENRPEHAREAEECPSVACLYGRGHLVGQTGEMAKTGIFYSNRCAIAHGSGGELGVRECRGLKINSGMPGVLRSGTAMAVKVFNLQLDAAFKSFDTECDVLCSLRHKNLVKVITSCSNLDFKALVLKYMPNGSPEKYLYSQNYFLDTNQRLSIMIDVACALEYLHHGCSLLVIHCDVKPSNVLLDEDMVAHLSDFGISKLLGED
ncbi:hypothetical protein BC332_33164 [Capsicum chinense]|nr:hypothetical protein BC332_33164 [Capsicum chinense]